MEIKSKGTMKKQIKNISYLLLLCLLSFSINFYSANIGVLPIDTFLHYDSSSNILKGDIPIRDFWIVHGLTIDYMQVIFFKIFGVNWMSYITHPSVFNTLITITTFKFFTLFKIKSFYSFLLAVSFSILAYPVSGTLFIDQHAIFFCLISYYLFFFGIKKDSRYFYFIPFFFLLAFFSKPVPTIYLASIFVLIILFYLFVKKDLKVFKNLLIGSIISIIFLYFFLIIQNINLNAFLTQLIYYPASIGQERLLTLDINFYKIVSNFKFIILPLLIFIILFFNQKKSKDKKEILFLFLVFSFFNIFSIYHQLLTKNQNFIFFLIPLNLSFIILVINNLNWNKKAINISIVTLFIFCFLTTAKYYNRFINEKKFHDFQNVDLSNSIPAKKIHNSLFPLRWKTFNYDQPIREIKLIKEVLDQIENEEEKILLMTNYNFISSITKKKIIMLSRTYDDISFPKKENPHYLTYKTFFLNKMKINNISKIYLVVDEKYKEASASRFIFEYFDKDCFESKNVNNILTKYNFQDCE